MKKIAIVTVLMSYGVFLTGCSEQKLDTEERLKQVVENYMQINIKEGMKKYPEANFSLKLDSLQIKDTITAKKKLGLEVLELKKKALKLTEEGNELAEDYQDKKELLGMYSDLSQKEDAYNVSAKHDLEKIKKQWEGKSKEAEKILESINVKMDQFQKVDSIKPLYYYVFSYFTLKDNKKDTQKDVFAPFHISKDFMIIKEPEEILNE